MGLCKIADGLLGICMIALSLLAAIIRRRWSNSGGAGRSRESCKLPLGTLGLPFLGETLEFISSAYSPRPESFMDKRRLKYGKVFKSHIFGNPTIVSTDPEVTRFVLQSDARTFVPAYPRSLTELIGKSSILLINGGVQRRLHGLIGSFLKSPHLKAQVTRDMQRYVAAATARWGDDGHLVHVQDDTKQMAFQVLVRALMSMEPGDDMQFLMQQFKEFIAGLISLPVKMPGTRLYRSLQSKKKMVRMIQGIVEERRRRKEEEEEAASPSSPPSPPPPLPPRDVLEVLLGDNSGQLTDELICDNMVDLMIPGEDSVPLLMTLAVKFLSDCPLALRQLEEENMELMRKKYSQSGELCWMDYVSLPFTQNVITETLRLGNINYGTMRKAMRDVEIKGHLIPKGWCVLTYFRSVHLDEDLYKDPYEFNPWRWQGTPHFDPGEEFDHIIAEVNRFWPFLSFVHTFGMRRIKFLA